MIALTVTLWYVAGVHSTLATDSLHSETCVCVNGTGIKARSHPGNYHASAVVGVYNSGKCFQASGVKHMMGGDAWQQINDGSLLLWIAEEFLTKGTSGQCDALPCSDLQKSLACQLLNSPNVVAAKAHASGMKDNAYAYNNLYDMCAGRPASRSNYNCTECPTGAPGGTVCLSTVLLKYLVSLQTSGLVTINELAGGCHMCTSHHYSGLAVDLGSGARGSEYVTKCNAMGGKGIDEKNHIHCQF